MKRPLFVALAALALSSTPAFADTNLVTNGSFEVPGAAGNFLAGWTSVGLNTPYVITASAAAGSAAEGTNFANLGCLPYYGGCGLGGWQNSALAQTLTTEAGKTYALSYFLEGGGYYGFGQDVFNVYWNGNLVTTTAQADTWSGPGAWSNPYTWYQFTATGLVGTGHDTLTLSLSDSPQVWGSVNLDNVSVAATAAVPEPETYALMLAGGVLLAALKRRRQA